MKKITKKIVSIITSLLIPGSCSELNAYDEEINQDTKIYLIAILISSLFIYNSFGPIDEPALETLSFIINL